MLKSGQFAIRRVQVVSEAKRGIHAIGKAMKDLLRNHDITISQNEISGGHRGTAFTALVPIAALGRIALFIPSFRRALGKLGFMTARSIKADEHHNPSPLRESSNFAALL